MMLATPVRNREWSSTTSTRAWSAVAPAGVLWESADGIVASRNGERRRLPCEDDFSTRSRGGDEGQRRANPLGALPHARHAEPGRRAVATDASAVIRHRQPEPHTAHGAGTHDDAMGASMANGVGERFLGDADDLPLDAVGERRQVV